MAPGSPEKDQLAAIQSHLTKRAISAERHVQGIKSVTLTVNVAVLGRMKLLIGIFKADVSVDLIKSKQIKNFNSE